RAVSDTTPPLNKPPPRTRQTRPSPRISHLRSFIPHAPLSSPFGYRQIGYHTRKVVPIPRNARTPAPPPLQPPSVGPLAQPLLPPAFAPLNPEKFQPPYDAVHWAARCSRSL